MRFLRWLFRRSDVTHLLERCVFLDESGINLAMTRSHARAPRGQRAHAHVPKNWGDSVTLVAAVRLDGLVGPQLIRGSMTGEAFESYIEQCIVPELKPGDVLLLDNLGAHKRTRVRELIEAAGATICFLPPYSPDTNPIELVWSKVKALLRGAAARCFDSLVDATASALRAVSRSDIANWFRHCGYVQ